MNGALNSAIRLHLAFFALPLADIDDSSRDAVVDISGRSNDLLNADIHLGTTNEMAGALRSQDAAHNVRSARNQNGTAVTRSANVVRQREQHRIIVLNLGRVQRFVENDRKDGPF